MRPRPKFCCGQQVIVLGMNGKTEYGPLEISRMRYVWCQDFQVGEKLSAVKNYQGWVYEFFGVFERAIETQLRHLPPSQNIQWEDTYFQPKRDEVVV